MCKYMEDLVVATHATMMRMETVNLHWCAVFLVEVVLQSYVTCI